MPCRRGQVIIITHNFIVGAVGGRGGGGGSLKYVFFLRFFY